MIVCGDARRIPLADDSVQCVVTSPPYWGLRKYAGEQDLIWTSSTGNLVCAPSEHHFTEETQRVEMRQGAGLEALSERYRGGGHSQAALAEPYTVTRGTCLRCGAWRGAFGLETTIEMYVQHTVEVLREVRRVLRPDGVCFWNIGDSYAANGGHADTACNERRGAYNLGNRPEHNHREFRQRANGGTKPKDLCLMPARVALAAQADGWWVRSMIIWAKPNPMPESVTDRPTDAYEHIIMLTKSARYFWDADAVRESGTSGPSDVKKLLEQKNRIGGKTLTDGEPLHKANAGTHIGQKRAVGHVWQDFGYTPKGTHARGNGDGGPKARERAGEGNHEGWAESTQQVLAALKMRNVWMFATQPYSGAHFATFPEELPRRCILAASRPGDLVLDPFAGSGTTGRVVVELRRRAVLLDLAYSHDYAPLARQRTTEVQIGLL